MDPTDPTDRPNLRTHHPHHAQQVRDPYGRAPLTSNLFRFSQLELPWALGPPDGRYLMRRPGDAPDDDPAFVLLFATLGAPERRRWLTSRKPRDAPPEPEPTPVTTGRATIIDVAEPFSDVQAADRWLVDAGEADLERDLAVLNHALHALRLINADPYLNVVRRSQALVARIGYGVGDEVADGRWTQARELIAPAARERRATVLHPQARLAAVLTGREKLLVCEELTLRAHLDLEHGRPREAALQVLVALDATVAELTVDPTAQRLTERLDELRGQRDAVAAAAQVALAGELSEAQLETVAFTLRRIESALRARAVANA